ncbi:MAG: inorganic phosphate transporter [Oscillospiraceae bacterium]|nr:inorganic phosphate transporter [Oscillospiraceae bacterium]
MGLETLFLTSGAFMGWSVGTNDASNVFGTAVGTKVIKFRTAIWLTAIFAVLGAVIAGQVVVGDLGDVAYNHAVRTPLHAFIVMLISATVVTVMTIIKAPVSTSQSLIGALMGWGFAQSMGNFAQITRFFSAWIISPILTMFVCLTLCVVAQRFIEARVKGLAAYDRFIKIGYLVAGIFGAFTLGANNAGNAMGVYYRTGIFDGPVAALNSVLPFTVTPLSFAAFVGGLMLGIGALTYSKRVMLAVGEGIAQLSPLQGFLVVFSSSVTLLVFSIWGISISTSQAVVGAIMGASFSKGHRGLDFKVLGRIFVAWFGTPTLAGLLAFVVGRIFF